jgi:hypothetical protein
MLIRPAAPGRATGPSHVEEKSGVQLVVPAQYMDKWRLDRSGISAVSNAGVRKTLGFTKD